MSRVAGGIAEKKLYDLEKFVAAVYIAPEAPDWMVNQYRDRSPSSLPAQISVAQAFPGVEGAYP